MVYTKTYICILLYTHNNNSCSSLTSYVSEKFFLDKTPSVLYIIIMADKILYEVLPSWRWCKKQYNFDTDCSYSDDPWDSPTWPHWYPGYPYLEVSDDWETFPPWEIGQKYQEGALFYTVTGIYYDEWQEGYSGMDLIDVSLYDCYWNEGAEKYTKKYQLWYVVHVQVWLDKIELICPIPMLATAFIWWIHQHGGGIEETATINGIPIIINGEPLKLN